MYHVDSLSGPPPYDLRWLPAVINILVVMDNMSKPTFNLNRAMEQTRPDLV